MGNMKASLSSNLNMPCIIVYIRLSLAPELKCQDWNASILKKIKKFTAPH